MTLQTMNGKPELVVNGHVIEQERYEFFESPSLMAEFNRRDFFRIAGAGVVVACIASDALAQQPRRGPGGAGGGDIGTFIHVGADSKITVYSGKVELGQNVRTSLAQAVAEELRVPMDRISMVLADTQLVPYDGGTFGSQSTPQMAPQLRRAAAAMRETLFDLAAEKGGADVARARLTIQDGAVTDPQTKKIFAFGDLTKGEKIAKAVGNATTTPAAQWKVAGTSVKKVNGRDMVMGKHRYTSDITRPGMLYAKVLRPPSYDATLVSVDTKDAEKMPNVKVVHEQTFVGVVAPTVYEAEEALAALKVEWRPAQHTTNSDNIYTELKRSGSGGGGGRRGRNGGEVDLPQQPVLLQAPDAKSLNVSFNIAYIAHAPLEPRAAVAEWDNGRLTVWTGTQAPFRIRDDVARTLGLASDRVRLIAPDTGSGYGGKHTNTAAADAARLSRAVGKPVKLIFTREEEFWWGYFRPAGVIDVTSAVGADGKISSWNMVNYNSGGSAVASPYAILGKQSRSAGADSPLKQGSYRALAATANNFARESAMDDLAKAAETDPLEFRLKHLNAGAANGPDARIRAVLQAAAKQFGWGTIKSDEKRSVGLACGTDKGGYVATCVEIATDLSTGSLKIVRTVTAFECGAIVNPDQLKNQVEGAVIMGIGGALFEQVQFAEGKIKNASFSNSKYRLPRFNDVPVMECVLVNRPDLNSAGAGEAPIICIAPAIRNAILAGTGIKLYKMPLLTGGLLKDPAKQV